MPYLKKFLLGLGLLTCHLSLVQAQTSPQINYKLGKGNFSLNIEVSSPSTLFCEKTKSGGFDYQEIYAEVQGDKLRYVKLTYPESKTTGKPKPEELDELNDLSIPLKAFDWSDFSEQDNIKEIACTCQAGKKYIALSLDFERETVKQGNYEFKTDKEGDGQVKYEIPTGDSDLTLYFADKASALAFVKKLKG